MNIKKINRKVDAYYESNGERLQKFAQDVLSDRFMNMSEFIKLSFTEYVGNACFEYPDKIAVGIRNICTKWMMLNPYMSDDEYDKLIRASLLFHITREKFDSIVYQPLFHHDRIMAQLRHALHHNFDAVTKETYNYISSHLLLLSEIFNIPFETIYNVNMMYGYKYSLSYKKFKKCSQYSDFKLLLKYFTHIDSNIILDKEFERKYMGYNYRLSYINVKTTNGKIVRIKNGVHWFYDNMNSLFKTMNQSDLRIVNIECGYIDVE